MQGYGASAISVYLLDDHDIVRRGLRELLAVKRDITVVGDSGSAQQAVHRILELAPDVVVLDLQLQDGNGITVCRAVRAADPTVQALLLTSAPDDEALAAALLAGAAGYATKLAGTTDILDRIRAIGAGGTLLDRSLAARASEPLLSAGSVLADDHRLVLKLVLEGLTDADIAQETGMGIERVTNIVVAVVEHVSPAVGLRGRETG